MTGMISNSGYYEVEGAERGRERTDPRGESFERPVLPILVHHSPTVLRTLERNRRYQPRSALHSFKDVCRATQASGQRVTQESPKACSHLQQQHWT